MPRKKEGASEKERVTVFLEPSISARLNFLQERFGVSRAAFLQMALVDYLDQHFPVDDMRLPSQQKAA